MTTTVLKGSVTLASDTGTTLTMNKPITIGYAPSAITANTMIGYTIEDPITVTATWVSGTFTDLFTPITLPAGVWMINYSVRFLSASTSTLGDIFVLGQDSITGITPPLSIAGNSITQTINTSGISFTGSFPVVSTGTTTYTISGVVNYSGGNVVVQLGTAYGSSVRRTRIA